MMKSKTLERLMRSLITLLGMGVGAVAATMVLPLLARTYPETFLQPFAPVAVYAALCILCGLILFLLSKRVIKWMLQLGAMLERQWDAMPTQQIVLACIGLILGLAVAALINQLVLSAGANLLTISFSAIIYVMLGTLGLQIGFRRYKQDGKRLFHKWSRRRTELADTAAELMEDAPETDTVGTRKILDTSVIIDGRILDVVRTGFMEGELIAPQFVLAELQHIADSSDAMRRARGRRGLDVLGKLRQEKGVKVTVNLTDYDDVAEVDVKLLRLCQELGGVVVTNDYNLNKVAAVTGIRVLNINDLANAVKPMLMAGEELTVQITREGKEPGQGVAYLDDGTMIVVENGRRFVGENVPVVVTTVLQTSAGRMIFTRLKAAA